jgi:hypothetical protein
VLSYARSVLFLALAGRRVLAPASFLLFAVVGVFVDPRNSVQGSWAVTAVLSCAFCAWLVVAVERDVGPSAEAMLTVRIGGARHAWRGRLMLVALLAGIVTLAFMLWPTVTSAFNRTPGAADVGAGALSNLASAAVGGALALLLASPVRPAAAFAVVVSALVASLALAGPLGPLAGPGGVATALGNAPNDRLTTGEVVAWVVTFAQAAALAYTARRLVRWRG